MKQRVVIGMDHRLSAETIMAFEEALRERRPEIDWILIGGAIFATDLESEAKYLASFTVDGPS